MISVEQAALKTLIYADIFDYPLKAWEIHKWLIGKKASLKQVESAFGRLTKKLEVKSQQGYCFLPSRENLVGKRLSRARQSRRYLQQIQLTSQLFKLIPWVKLVGVSGSLAMDNATNKDDIDLMVVTVKNRLWLSRICLLVLLELIGKRRKKTDDKREAAGKMCVNLLLDEDSLAQQGKDIYLAHEVLQMKPLWYRDNLYQKYLEVNDWVFKFLPNWHSSDGLRMKDLRLKNPPKLSTTNQHSLINLLENLAKWWQLKYMGRRQGRERVSATALYFHPEDYRPQVLFAYTDRLKKLASIDRLC